MQAWSARKSTTARPVRARRCRPRGCSTRRARSSRTPGCRSGSRSASSRQVLLEDVERRPHPARRSGCGRAGTAGRISSYASRPMSSRLGGSVRVHRGSREHSLAAEERLRVGARRVALHAAQAQQAREQVLPEPVLGPLGGEVVHQVRDLALREPLGERDERVRARSCRRRTWAPRTRGSGGRGRCSRSARRSAGGPGGGRRADG